MSTIPRHGAHLDDAQLQTVLDKCPPDAQVIGFELRQCWELLNRTTPRAVDKSNLFLSALMMNGYQNRVSETARYPKEIALNYLLLKLCAEAGEASQEVARMHLIDKSILTGPRRAKLLDELGDVLWYVSQIAFELEEDLSEIAHNNLIKVTTRGPKGLPTPIPVPAIQTRGEPS
jgi:NTP pyrophosphatase (non-canonical NTP hydrolase)